MSQLVFYLMSVENKNILHGNLPFSLNKCWFLGNVWIIPIGNHPNWPPLHWYSIIHIILALPDLYIKLCTNTSFKYYWKIVKKNQITKKKPRNMSKEDSSVVPETLSITVNSSASCLIGDGEPACWGQSGRGDRERLRIDLC